MAITVLFAAGFVALDLSALVVERLFTRSAALLHRLAFAAPFCLLPLLALYALFGAIASQLAR